MTISPVTDPAGYAAGCAARAGPGPDAGVPDAGVPDAAGPNGADPDTADSDTAGPDAGGTGDSETVDRDVEEPPADEGGFVGTVEALQGSGNSADLAGRG